VLVRDTQKEDTIKAKVTNGMYIYKDSNNIWRVKSRIKRTNDPYYLNNKNKLAKLFISYLHDSTMH
jgi:hypothetical protein